MIRIDTSALRERVGQEVGVSGWITLGQDRINRFADATGDHQWIHIDAPRAAAESPFGTTIAHGFLTLSLISALLREAIELSGLRLAVNYGLNRVRFVSPVPAGARVRGRFTLGALEETGGALQALWQVVVERDGGDRPCLVAEWLVRYYPNP